MGNSYSGRFRFTRDQNHPRRLRKTRKRERARQKMDLMIAVRMKMTPRMKRTRNKW
jgi:hypothetical protein